MFFHIFKLSFFLNFQFFCLILHKFCKILCRHTFEKVISCNFVYLLGLNNIFIINLFKHFIDTMDCYITGTLELPVEIWIVMLHLLQEMIVVTWLNYLLLDCLLFQSYHVALKPCTLIHLFLYHIFFGINFLGSTF